MFDITLKDIFHDWWRSLLTMVSLAVIITGYLVLAALAGMLQNFGQQSGITNNIVVLAADTIDPMDSKLTQVDQDQIFAIANSHIDRVFPAIYRHLKIDEMIMQVRAIDVGEMPAGIGLQLVEGDWPGDGFEIVVDHGLAASRDWKPGSVINIYGTDFTISGLVLANNVNSNSIWMSFEQGQRLFQDGEKFQALYLVLDSMQDPGTIRDQFESAPGIQQKYNIYLENSIDDGVRQAVHNLIMFSRLLSIVSLVAITFGVYNFVLLNLTERGRDIRILQILGFSLWKLRMVLLVRVLFLLLPGYTIGALATRLILEFHQVQHPIALAGLAAHLELNGSLLFFGFMLAALFCAAGVFLSSRKMTGLTSGSGRG